MPIKKPSNSALNIIYSVIGLLVAAAATFLSVIFYNQAIGSVRDTSLEAVNTLSIMVEPEQVRQLQQEIEDIGLMQAQKDYYNTHVAISKLYEEGDEREEFELSGDWCVVPSDEYAELEESCLELEDEVYELIAVMEEDSLYSSMKKNFADIANYNNEFVFVYLMGVNDDGEFFFYIDSSYSTGEDGEEEQAYPGEIYPDYTDKMVHTVEYSEAQFDDLDPTGDGTDEWGTWISAYAPIVDEDGSVVAMIGIDIDHSQYNFSVITTSIIPAIVGFLFLFVVYYMWRYTTDKERKLARERELLSIASHEVRSPMISLKWVLDDLVTHPNLPETDKTTLQLLSNNTDKIIGSVNGILSSASTWGNGNRGKEDVNVVDILQGVIDRTILVSRERNINIRMSDQLAQSNVTVRGSASSLDHVFYNLINNALKYASENSEVTISYARGDGFNQFKVSDKGPGVKPEDREKIFEGSYRTKEAIESGQVGTGLGLYFVKKIIVNDYKGKIFVDPNYQGGTSFVLSIPD